MSRIAYVNGRYLPMAHAHVSVLDRGLLFADSVYEVVFVKGGRLIDAERHLARLERSLDAIMLQAPIPRTALAHILNEVRRRNRLAFGGVYLQITRGAPSVRDHAFPAPDTPPTVFCFVRAADERRTEARAAAGVRVITAPDHRWGGCAIKSTGLLPNVLAKQRAQEQGAFEAWFLDADAAITEGASSNAWIVTQDGALITRELSANILPGITRAAVVELAATLQMRIEERPFSLEEARNAREAFTTSAMALITPVIAIDAHIIGDGQPGPVATRLRALYRAAAEAGRL